METAVETHHEATSEQTSSRNSDRLFNEVTTILRNSAHLSKSKKEKLLFYFGIISLAGLTISVALTDPIYNAKLLAASGIIVGLAILKRFDLK